MCATSWVFLFFPAVEFCSGFAREARRECFSARTRCGRGGGGGGTRRGVYRVWRSFQLCPSKCLGYFFCLLFPCGRFSLWVCMKRGWRGVETHELAADEAVVVVAAPPLSWFITCVSHVNCVRPIVLLVLVLLFSLSWRLCSGPARISIVLIVPIECFWLLGCFIVFPSGVKILLWAFHVSILSIVSIKSFRFCCVLLFSLRLIFALGLYEKTGRGVYHKGGGGGVSARGCVDLWSTRTSHPLLALRASFSLFFY